MSLYEYHRLYLTTKELEYLCALILANLTGIIPKPDSGNQPTHVSIANKLIRQKDRIDEYEKIRQAKK
jgi:hypothetical protein